MTRLRLSFFLQNLSGGGAERVALSLLNALAVDHDVDLVLVRREGPYLDDVSPSVRLHSLDVRKTSRAIKAFSAWLKVNRPDVVVSHLTHVNVAAVLAVRLSGTGIPIVAVEHNQIRLNYDRLAWGAVKLAYFATPLVYRMADAVVSVSEGVEQSIKAFTGLSGPRFSVIHNPVVFPGMIERANAPAKHPFLDQKQGPVLVSCGRLMVQKDFATLLRALALLRAGGVSARSIILGEGPDEAELRALARELSIEDAVNFAGFDSNPFRFMRAADLFVLSSRWEGLPTVLIEALALGTAVVSTDCPSGPREILKAGELGRLARVGDPVDLAAKIADELARPSATQEQRRTRGLEFSIERSRDRYVSLFEMLTGKAAAA